MDADDRQTGRILTRRELLKLAGVSGALLLAGCVPGLMKTVEEAAPETNTPFAPSSTAETTGIQRMCVVKPELTAGPFYLDEELNRADIRSDPGTGVISEGTALALTFNVSQISTDGCIPLEGAKVEIWHCDALGVYSGVADAQSNSRDQKFLRGYQLTNADGQASFMTIYPGWYPGRTVHIHFKVHQSFGEQSVEFTSQLFFDDALSDQVFSQTPYAGRNQRRTRNSNDGIFREELLLDVSESGEGFSTVFNIGLQIG